MMNLPVNQTLVSRQKLRLRLKQQKEVSRRKVSTSTEGLLEYKYQRVQWKLVTFLLGLTKRQIGGLIMNSKLFHPVLVGYLVIGLFSAGSVLLSGQTLYAAQRIQEALSASHLHRANVYVEAGDYRRAVEACQQYLDEYPSVEGYVYLAYVYEAIDGYLAELQKRDDWVKVGQVALNLTSRELIDIIDPPNAMPRMAREMIHEGLRQQFDIASAMANRLDKKQTEKMWIQQAAWRKANPDDWWSGVPKKWDW